MSHLEIFTKMLSEQIAKDFDKEEYEVRASTTTVGDTNVVIKSSEIGFVFNKKGQFEGIYNYKY